MAFADWVMNTAANVRRDPVWGLKKAGSELVMGGLRRVEPYRDRGVNIYDREWDVAVVLDACRSDLMAQVADEYDWFDYEERIWSLGATSPEWIERTFAGAAPEELARTAYVTWNPWSVECAPAEDIGSVDEVWRYAWDDDAGGVLPRSMTDRAISVHRDHDPERLVVHYMQPHVPFLASDLSEGLTLNGFRETRERNVWHELRDGNVSHDAVWDAYLENLRVVLDDVELLVRNVDADRVAITSDHGNAMGELEQYGHERNMPLRCAHEVPWCVTTGTDEGTYEPKLEPTDESEAGAATDRLEDLGYL